MPLTIKYLTMACHIVAATHFQKTLVRIFRARQWSVCVLTDEDFAFTKAPSSKKARESGKQEAKKSSSQDSQSIASQQNRFGISLIYKTLHSQNNNHFGYVADVILDVNNVSYYQEFGLCMSCSSLVSLGDKQELSDEFKELFGPFSYIHWARSEVISHTQQQCLFTCWRQDDWLVWGDVWVEQISHILYPAPHTNSEYLCCVGGFYITHAMWLKSSKQEFGFQQKTVGWEAAWQRSRSGAHTLLAQ